MFVTVERQRRSGTAAARRPVDAEAIGRASTEWSGRKLALREPGTSREGAQCKKRRKFIF
jgi:hypothetical protein